jgi:3-phenylpropionate/cinnamic acid dioxygenase small subunit
MITVMEPSPYEAITKLLFTYARRIDDGDFEGIGEHFKYATMTFEGFGEAITGAEAITTLYHRTTRRYENGTPNTKHVITNVMVDVADDGLTATSQSYFTVLQAVPGVLTLQPIIAGRYRNGFEHVDGQWRFSSVHIIIELMGDLAHHMLIDLAP